VYPTVTAATAQGDGTAVRPDRNAATSVAGKAPRPLSDATVQAPSDRDQLDAYCT
jgi:hypothetical protein